jgi:hypothetical protein
MYVVIALFMIVIKKGRNKNSKERKYSRGTRFVGATIVKDKLYSNYFNSTAGQVTDCSLLRVYASRSTANSWLF